MLGAQHAAADLQQGLMLGLGLFQPPQIVQHQGMVAPAGQGVGVLGAQHAAADLQ